MEWRDALLPHVGCTVQQTQRLGVATLLQSEVGAVFLSVCLSVCHGAVGMSDCATPDGVVTGEWRIEGDVERSGRVLVGVPYPGETEVKHETAGVSLCLGRPNVVL